MSPLPLVLFVFSVYLSTISPTVYLGDSGELTAAAFSLGIPHNSGYPLFALVGKIFCLIPLGNIGFRMNLMSASFAGATVWLVYALIYRITSSKVGAIVGSLILAFTPVFWSQTVSAEVYTLHAFLVVLLITLLWRWDEQNDLSLLILFVFITGMSFGNHLQTVMLAPAVLYIILSANKKILFDVKNLLLLSMFFIVPLLIYAYLPIRTGAGAAIHWGDPDNLERFLAHVTGQSHRGAYVLNKSPIEYIDRMKETFQFVWSQLNLVLFFSVWGWIKLSSSKWRIFFILVILFDFIYTIFLNFISLEVTAFTLPTTISLTLLAGIGITGTIKACEDLPGISQSIRYLIKGACCIIPAIFLIFNFSLSNQSKNYTAHEQAINIFRTIGHGDILFIHGDNNVFPVAYARIVERMREDVKVYDRLNLIFKLPNLEAHSRSIGQGWEGRRNAIEKLIIEKKGGRAVYFAVFAPDTVQVSSQQRLVPFGLINKVMKRGEIVHIDQSYEVWRYYSRESFNDDFHRDFMTREVAAFFYFNHAKLFFALGQFPTGLKYTMRASQVGYNDDSIHSEIAIFLIDKGLFEEGRKELEKALIYHRDLSGVYNNWGYYYHKIGDYEKAIASFKNAVELSPNNFGYYNHLGFSLYEAGDRKEAYRALQDSLAIEPNQPNVHAFIRQHLYMPGPKKE